MESRVELEEANLERLRTESHMSKERKLGCSAQNEKLHTIVTQKREENMLMLEERVKREEKLQMLKDENRGLEGLDENLNREVVDASTEMENLEQQLASVEAEEAQEEARPRPMKAHICPILF